MHVLFSEEELAAIDLVPFAWNVKDGTPKALREAIERKLNAIDNQQIGPRQTRKLKHT